MPPEQAHGLRDLMDRVRSEVTAHELPEADPEEVELHAPLPRQRDEPVEIDPATEAILRRRLGR
jgi:hypothetical protein